MRGEDIKGAINNVPVEGSPPHARGRRNEHKQCPVRGWITPACAGKTGRRGQWSWGNRDHPRMRGEDGRVEMFALPEDGITPACAGKTVLPRIHNCSVTDHPRMRGEDCSACAPRTSKNGSPPHARGRL